MKETHDNPILTVIKAAQPVNEQGEPDKWGERREGDFAIIDGRMYYMRKGHDSKKKDDNDAPQVNEIPTALTDNFIAFITEQIILDDGAKQETAFRIEGRQKNGAHLPVLIIPATQYQAMQWPLRHWGARAIVEADQATPRRLANAILKLSRNIPIVTTYQHTGWRLIDDEWHYLTGSGAIGAAGLNSNIRVELGEGHIKKYALPAPSENPRQFAGKLFELLHVSERNPAIGAVLFCAVVRAVLGECLPVDFSLFMVGRSGSQKSECTALAMACFGAFDSRSFPANFTDTEADLEHKSHSAKDAMFSVDDFAPSVNQQEANKLHAKAERLFRGVGNQAGRGRRNADMSGKAAYAPRCMLIASGEDLPRGTSLLARLLVADIKRGDVDLNYLSKLQNLAQRGELTAAVSAFLQWLAPRINELKCSFPSEVRTIRDKALQEKFAISHPRAADIYASLYASADLFIRFAEEVGTVNSFRANDLMNTIESRLKAIVKAQGQYQKQADEVERFVMLLRACFSAGEVHVGDNLNQGPPALLPFVWGWRSQTPGGDPSGCGSHIGYINQPKRELWLEPEPTFRAIQRFATAQNDPLLINRATLWKRLHERGLLLASEKDNKTGTPRPDVHKSMAGKRCRVLVLNPSIITGGDSE
ncbi:MULTISPECIES: hypothetical protein [Methylomonas]|uniref:DUF927 domain-containing protein n=2 Tax=Methylomonas TaxID=416 RepID=A0A140E6P4_9GAMM|nr:MULTISPECIES: hypothetical protein [Methylomonas]AMK79068.1 hypothetical protein JT25_021715 [Methylomonas denitrificans]OAI09287.1 hypothetical protein A1342_02845 [Methylomonas methanica]TCV79137.1 hypothetical protein EDE11_12110 [Methylomonas methanica]